MHRDPPLSRRKFSAGAVKARSLHFGFVLLKDRKDDINAIAMLMW